jgi:hypothetical protein
MATKHDLVSTHIPKPNLRLKALSIHTLFKDNVSSPHYITSNGKIISEQNIRKDVERTGDGLTGETTPGLV